MLMISDPLFIFSFNPITKCHYIIFWYIF